jgi:hypothetical protein
MFNPAADFFVGVLPRRLARSLQAISFYDGKEGIIGALPTAE